jgi:hypothetical protein
LSSLPLHSPIPFPRRTHKDPCTASCC